MIKNKLRALKAVGRLNATASTEELNKFADASKVAEYASESILALVEAGIVQRPRFIA